MQKNILIRPFTAVTWVRISLGSPNKKEPHLGRFFICGDTMDSAEWVRWEVANDTVRWSEGRGIYPEQPHWDHFPKFTNYFYKKYFVFNTRPLGALKHYPKLFLHFPSIYLRFVHFWHSSRVKNVVAVLHE